MLKIDIIKLKSDNRYAQTFDIFPLPLRCRDKERLMNLEGKLSHIKFLFKQFEREKNSVA